MLAAYTPRLTFALFACYAALALGCASTGKLAKEPAQEGVVQPSATAEPVDKRSAAQARPPGQESTPPASHPANEADTEQVAAQPSLRRLCRQDTESHGKEGEKTPALDTMRQRIAETFCGATLWLDGMFGDAPNIENAQAVSGRIKLIAVNSEFEGTDAKLRLRIKYELPNLEQRLNLFLGREDESDFVEDRHESFPVLSSVFGLTEEEDWLAGLGYSPPGKWRQRFDVRVGGRLDSSPEIFVQGRMRNNIFVGESAIWRFRQSVFWENRDGFGLTSKAELDRILFSNLLGRWSTVATISEATDGVSWRTSGLLYHNINSKYAMAYQAFVRGATNHEVPLREYGGRVVFRRPLNRQWLFGEIIAGYSWPQDRLDQPRTGSALIGLGIELHFGDNPY
jgi:hypothetical protein